VEENAEKVKAKIVRLYERVWNN